MIEELAAGVSVATGLSYGEVLIKMILEIMLVGLKYFLEHLDDFIEGLI